jgi:hypothetical protein
MPVCETTAPPTVTVDARHTSACWLYSQDRNGDAANSAYGMTDDSGAGEAG